MSLNNPVRQEPDSVLAVRLAGPPFRAAIEKAVSEHLKRRWAVSEARDMADFACHPSAILSDGAYGVFAKFSDAPDGVDQFEIELAGLRLLSEVPGVLTPTPIGIIPAAGGSLFVLEAVQIVDRAPHHWRQIGQTLACIHRVSGDRFGLEAPGYFGVLPQDNTPSGDWPAFYAERRLGPGLRLAVDSGNLPAALVRQVEKVISRLPELCGPEVTPALLHGDAQQNNFISTEKGAVVIDPAVYYGNPEMDLAMVDYFQAMPDDVFDAYQEELPIDPGFGERRELWRIWGYLACVTVEGAGYLPKLINAVQKYL